MKYSPSKNAFWRDDLQYADAPSDMIDISDELYQQLIEGINNLKVIVPNGTNLPFLNDLPEMTQAQFISAAQGEKIRRITQASDAIKPLEYAEKLGMATDNEQALLIAWEKYLVLLNRVDVSVAPDIVWPDIPG